MRAGRLVEIERRLMCGSVSVAQVWWQAKYGRNDDDICWLNYHQPLGMPTFLTLDYIRSGSRAGYKTFVGACHVLDEIARIRGAANRFTCCGIRRELPREYVPCQPAQLLPARVRWHCVPWKRPPPWPPLSATAA